MRVSRNTSTLAKYNQGVSLLRVGQRHDANMGRGTLIGRTDIRVTSCRTPGALAFNILPINEAVLNRSPFTSNNRF
jgi:hypothetical protein